MKDAVVVLMAALLAILPSGCRRQTIGPPTSSNPAAARHGRSPTADGGRTSQETPSEAAWYRMWQSDPAASAVPERWRDLFATLTRSQAALDFDSRGRLIGADMASGRRVGGDAEIRAAVLLPHLRRLAVSGFGVTPSGVHALASCKTLEELGLENTQIDDTALAELASLPRLRSLNLRRSVHLTDAAIETLLRFPKLEQLYLHDNGFSAKSLRNLAALQGLRLLDLRGCPGVGIEVLREICRIPNLTDLRLRGYSIDDPCMEVVANCRAMSAFTLEEAAVTGKGLSRLADLPIASLTLYKCLSIGEDDLAVLARMPHLVRLSLRDMPVRGDFLRFLRDGSQLTELRLYQTMVSDSVGEHLSRLQSLRRLDLSKTLVSDPVTAALAKLTSLEELALAETMVTDQGLLALQALKDLRQLDLSGTIGVTDETIATLEALPKLQTVFLAGTSVTREGLARLGDLAKAAVLPGE